MSDIFDDIPAFEDIKRIGFEEGKRKAQLGALRQAFIHVVEARFPKLLRLAREEAAIIDNPDELDGLHVKISIAQNTKEARAYLLNEQEDEDIN